MTPAQRRKKIAKFKSSNKQKGPSLGKLLWPLLTLFLAVGYIWATGRIFAKNPKLTVVVGGGEEVLVTTFDRPGGSVYNITVPAGTQVNVARQLGTWRAESVWRLGESEKLGGVLLTETILKNLKIPVNVWADANYLKLSYSKTNLGVGDRLRLAIFSMGVPAAKRVNINLAEAGFLKKTRLVGGDEGYVIGASLPQSLYDIFADPKINAANLRIEIENYSERKSGAETLAGVLEVLGTKVAAVTAKPAEDFLCEVSGEDREITEKIARIFGCKVSAKGKSDSFDLKIKIGEEFVKRY